MNALNDLCVQVAYFLTRCSFCDCKLNTHNSFFYIWYLERLFCMHHTCCYVCTSSCLILTVIQYNFSATNCVIQVVRYVIYLILLSVSIVDDFIYNCHLCGLTLASVHV